jgi:hypothetical protein
MEIITIKYIGNCLDTLAYWIYNICMVNATSPRGINAQIIVKAQGRTSPAERAVPRHIRINSPEIVAAQLVAELVTAAFLKHGIATAIHAPNLGELADAIAQGMGTADASIPMPAPSKELTEAEKAEHDEFIDGLIGN